MKKSFYTKLLKRYYRCGRMKLKTGVTDITTDDAHIEINSWYNWKDILGQLLLFNAASPRPKLKAYVYGDVNIDTRALCMEYLPKSNIELFELQIAGKDIYMIDFQQSKVVHKFNLYKDEQKILNKSMYSKIN